MKSSGVSTGLGQCAGAVDDLSQEVGHCFIFFIPNDAFLQSPACRVLPEDLLKMPGDRMRFTPQGVNISTHTENMSLFKYLDIGTIIFNTI